MNNSTDINIPSAQDFVLNSEQWNILTPSGFQPFLGFRVREEQETLVVTLVNGQQLTCTYEHEILTDRGCVCAMDLFRDDQVQTVDGFVSIESVEPGPTTTVYDPVDVQNGHQFIGNSIIQFQCIFLDEFAFVPENIAQDFMTSVFPTISSGQTTKLFIVSTPKGYNLFYKLWNDAEHKRNSYFPIGFTWRDVPGRDALDENGENIWEKEMRRNMGEMGNFEQEFNCSFQGSADTLIPSWKLAQLSYADPIYTRGDLKIYRKPVYTNDDGPAHIYLVTVDIGQGQGLDYSVINVTDISESPFRQVAVWRNNTLIPALVAPMIKEIAQYYANAFVFLEINGEAGIIADMLVNDLEYENVISVFSHPKKGQQLSTSFHPKARFGLRVTEATKRIGCSGFKSMMLNDRYIINDYETLRELTTYVAKNKSFAAEQGCHDDCISTLVLVGWLSLQAGFEEYIGISMRKLLMSGHETATFDAPFIGIFNVLDTPPQLGPCGFYVVDDPDFWREQPAQPVDDDELDLFNEENWLASNTLMPSKKH